MTDREVILKAHPILMHFVNLPAEPDPTESLDELITFFYLDFIEGESFEAMLNRQTAERRAELMTHLRVLAGAA